MRRAAPFLLPLVAAAGLSACGGSGEPAPPTVPASTTSIAANTAYERSYSECASNGRVELARKYNVKKNVNVIATAVGSSWAKRAGGGQDAVDAGKEGCLDGFAAAGG